MRHVCVSAIFGAAFLFCSVQNAAGTEFILREDSLAHSSSGRELLKYIVQCALESSDSVSTASAGVSYTFAGSLGLVPNWTKQALTPPQERLLSACIFARTNYFGKTVKISLRGNGNSTQPALLADAAEESAYALFEGKFFGNLFQQVPVSYVCTGSSDSTLHLRNLMRVCTLGNETGDKTVSLCGFKLLGVCSESTMLQEGVDYSNDAISVFLPALNE